MFIYWGTHRKDSRMGYVADFCPICREIQCFALNHVGMAGHLYGISLGGGKTIGHLEVCQSCGLTMPGEPSKFEHLVPKRTSDIASLVRSSYPNIYTECRERLALEARVRSATSEVSDSVRFGLLKEPFLVTAVHASTASKDTSSWPALALLAAFILPFVLGAATSAIPQLSTILMIVTFIGCIAFALWLGISESIVQSRRKPRSLLVRALRTLDPTPIEIGAAVNDAEVRATPTWNRVRAEKVVSWLAADKRRSPPVSAARPVAADV